MPAFKTISFVQFSSMSNCHRPLALVYFTFMPSSISVPYLRRSRRFYKTLICNFRMLWFGKSKHWFFERYKNTEPTKRSHVSLCTDGSLLTMCHSHKIYWWFDLICSHHNTFFDFEKIYMEFTQHRFLYCMCFPDSVQTVATYSPCFHWDHYFCDWGIQLSSPFVLAASLPLVNILAVQQCMVFCEVCPVFNRR